MQPGPRHPTATEPNFEVAAIARSEPNGTEDGSRSDGSSKTTAAGEARQADGVVDRGDDYR